MIDNLDHENSFEKIAIIGMAIRAPGAKNIDEFWSNLSRGIESVERFSEDELIASGVDYDRIKNPLFVNAGTVLPDADTFDADFFGINAREAEIMDPQHRVFLETAWEVLEDAGYPPETFLGAIGVFGGVAPNTYFQKNLVTRPELLDTLGRYMVMLSSEKEYAVTRVSYKLDLRGPSVSVNTACSSSAVAVHLACQSLLSGECDLALAGGARISVPLKSGYIYEEGGIPSPDGHCRAFDADARGTVIGNGVGMVALKRLSDAIADGDQIHAVIRSSAINNDGSQKVGFTAPSIQGQAAVIEDALALANINPEKISYVEAHGTGTSLGDPIEIAGLTNAYRKWTAKRKYCPIGSVKTNIGHLDAGAGVAGIIKTSLALKHEQIPPSLNFKQPNPQIDFENSPFFVNSELLDWPRGETPRFAGVSSFGLGGTNAHIILEESPEIKSSRSSRSHQLLLLSARTDNALDRATENLAEKLRGYPEEYLADVAYTLNVGRQEFKHRQMAVCQGLNDAIEALRSKKTGKVIKSRDDLVDRDVVFMFSGQGSQYVDMGLELYNTESLFRKKIDEYSEILKKHLFLDLRTILYPDNENLENANQLLSQTRYTQPALFAIELALANLWMDWGIMPNAMVGHSIGEYVAACLSGVFSVEDALTIIHYRGRLMQEMPEGSMLTIPLNEEEIQPYLNEKIALAVINNPELCTVAGDSQSINQLERRLQEDGITTHLLHTSHAFHSFMMEPMLAPFIEKFSNIKLNEPQIPFVSNVTGTWVTPDEATDPRYWARQLRNTVRFSDCLEELFKTPDQIYLEVGPGRTLSTLTNQHPKKPRGITALGSLRHPKEGESDVAYILNTLGRLWLSGKMIDWINFYKSEKRCRVSLPTYPFERKRYWIDPLDQKRDNSKTFTITPIDQVQSTQYQIEPDPGMTGLYPDAPRDDTEKSLAAIWGNLLGIDDLSIYDNFFEIGGSSLIALSLFAQINKTFGKNLSLATLFEAPTIEALANILRERDLPASWSPLVEIQLGNVSKTPFFLIHAEDGNVVAYRDLAVYLDNDQPVYGLQAKELSGEQIVAQKIEEIAAEYVREVRRIQPEGPYILGGFCLGGCLAYEMAQQIQKLGEEVALVVMIQARHRDYRKYLPSSTRLHRYYYRFVDRIDYEVNNLSKLGYKDKFSYIQRRIDRIIEIVQVGISRNFEPLSKLIQKDFTQSMAYTYANVAKKFNDAFWNYFPRPYNGRVVIFRASEQPRGIYSDPTLGWGELIKGELELYEINAYHQTIIQEPQVQPMAKMLSKCLNTVSNSDAL